MMMTTMMHVMKMFVLRVVITTLTKMGPKLSGCSACGAGDGYMKPAPKILTYVKNA